MRKSIYLGAEHLIGFFTVIPSAQWYSYLGPADITGQVSSVQNSVIVPYNMLIWLKKSTAVIEMIIAVCTYQPTAQKKFTSRHFLFQMLIF